MLEGWPCSPTRTIHRLFRRLADDLTPGGGTRTAYVDRPLALTCCRECRRTGEARIRELVPDRHFGVAHAAHGQIDIVKHDISGSLLLMQWLY